MAFGRVARSEGRGNPLGIRKMATTDDLLARLSDKDRKIHELLELVRTLKNELMDIRDHIAEDCQNQKHRIFDWQHCQAHI